MIIDLSGIKPGRYLPVEKDPLNSQKTRNRENTAFCDYNCGGLALNTFSWYLPWNDDDECEVPENTIMYLLEEDWDKDEIYGFLQERFLHRMLKDFSNLRLLDGPHDTIKENERLICFRFYYREEECHSFNPYEKIDFDFHFRYYSKQSECWVEKCGEYPIEFDCKMSKIWYCGSNHYDSKPVYLALAL